MSVEEIEIIKIQRWWNRVIKKPIRINCDNLRIQRQRENNEKVLKYLKSRELKFYNKKELDRVLYELNTDLENLLIQCEK